MAGEKQLTVAELVDGVMPCIKAKQYSETYIKGSSRYSTECFPIAKIMRNNTSLQNLHSNSFWNATAFRPEP